MEGNTTGLMQSPQQSNNVWEREAVKQFFYQQNINYKAGSDIWKQDVLAKRKAVIAAEQELQQTNVIIKNSGEVALERTTFDGSIQTKLPIEVLESILYCPQDQNNTNRVLKLTVINASHQEATIWLSPDAISKKVAKKAFLRAGISFGFGNKKEAQVLTLFLIAAVVNAKIQIIPYEHGWHQTDITFVYAYPDELTWKEVYSNAIEHLS